ncbi:hypothetical protein [Hyphococcus sp.]|uniref:hypothetical protein n=1 Tax=Hyphococcus sp. TaxID=2038636 RepID=UPI00207F152E|nr:MAG: hypothetical protein DHS20C04_32030 [Marinicaulis sp.]
MVEDRKQSPHYIPELDPENPESGPKMKQRFLWWLLIVGFAFISGGVVTYQSGYEKIGLILGVIGILLLAPFLPGIGW